MAYFHKKLAGGRWKNFSRIEQLAHIGSEYNRFIHWSDKGNKENATHSFDRLIELVDLSVNDEKWKNSLAELLRLREVICDKFSRGNNYNVSSKSLHFALIAKN